MVTPKTFTFVKNIKGSLYIDLETYDMMGARKTFVFGPTVDKIVVPFPYALGLFVSQEAMDQYKLGWFTIEHADELYKAGIENGFVAREEKPEITLLVDIENAIKSNKPKQLAKLIEKAAVEPTTADNIITVARENFDILSNEMVSMIEEATGVELRIE